MYQFYNAHPQNKLVGDCAKRAICTAANLNYKDISLQLNRYKKITGATKYNEKKNCYQFIENVLHGKKIGFPAEKGKPRMNGERFCGLFPKGRYILSMAGHLSCCIDGVIYDTWDCSEKCVYQAWKL